MTTYRIFFRDEGNWIVGREDFEVDTDPDALEIANALLDACSDRCTHFDLWNGRRLIAGPPVNVPGNRLSAGMEEITIRTEELIMRSQWQVAQSRRLLGRLNAIRNRK